MAVFCIMAYADSPGYINGDGVNFRAEPNGEILATYDAGQIVIIIRVDGEWTYCMIDGQAGYVWSAFVTVDTTPVEPDSIPEPTTEPEPTAAPEPTSEPEPSPDLSPEPMPEPTPAPTLAPDPEPTDVAELLAEDPTPSPEPTEEPLPTPEPTPSEYEVETLNVLANIQGYLIFFVVVILLYFAYKFLRMFF